MPDFRTKLKRRLKKEKTSARDLTMRQVLSVNKTRKMPSWRQWKQLPSVLSGGEKRTIFSLLGIIVVCLAVFTVSYVMNHRVVIPTLGGEYTEGLIGEPQFINPLYASNSDVDQDLERLIYSGLMKWSPDEGYILDLASNMEVSEDATSYTFTIREDAKFHNGDPVLARDVIFTVNAIQNPNYRSPLIDDFFGVAAVQESEQTITFLLEEPRPNFVQHLTVGILPAGLWAEILPQNAALAALNMQPIGSGPYQFVSFTKDQKGSIRNYTLKPFQNYYEQVPYIETLTFKFYSDVTSLMDGLENKNIEGASFVPFEALESIQNNKNVQLMQARLPQEIVLYFNQGISSVLADDNVRLAIAQAINKQSIVDNVYNGAATAIEGMLLEEMVGHHGELEPFYDPALAQETLEEAGYTLLEGTSTRELKDSLKEDTATEEEENESEETSAEDTKSEPQLLTLTLTAADTTEMRRVAAQIQEQLEQVGMTIQLNFVPSAFLAGEVIEPQNFEMLLLPLLLEANQDPYVFWHSSQGDGIGLNIIDYKNEDVDTLLESGQKETDAQARAQTYKEVEELLREDLPALFLYQPRYNYAVAEKINLDPVQEIIVPSDRFHNIQYWYIKTRKALR